jgi:hypothetical protein
MHITSKILGVVCAVLVIMLWIVTLAFDRTAGSIYTATALTAIVAAAGLLSLLP